MVFQGHTEPAAAGRPFSPAVDGGCPPRRWIPASPPIRLCVGEGRRNRSRPFWMVTSNDFDGSVSSPRLPIGCSLYFPAVNPRPTWLHAKAVGSRTLAGGFGADPAGAAWMSANSGPGKRNSRGTEKSFSPRRACRPAPQGDRYRVPCRLPDHPVPPAVTVLCVSPSRGSRSPGAETRRWVARGTAQPPHGVAAFSTAPHDLAFNHTESHAAGWIRIRTAVR